MGTKNVNYTPEQAEQAVKVYTAAETDEDRKAAVAKLAKEFGKSPASVRAKLVSEGVYQKPEYVTKKGEKPETKEAIVSEIADILSLPDSSVIESLASATKHALNIVRGELAAAREAIMQLTDQLNEKAE